MTAHMFCDDNILIDLRYLVGAETFDYLSDDDMSDTPYVIGYVLDVGHTPQRLSATYSTRAARDQAFQHLTARYQAWMAQAHANDYDTDDA